MGELHEVGFVARRRGSAAGLARPAEQRLVLPRVRQVYVLELRRVCPAMPPLNQNLDEWSVGDVGKFVGSLAVNGSRARTCPDGCELLRHFEAERFERAGVTGKRLAQGRRPAARAAPAAATRVPGLRSPLSGLWVWLVLGWCV